MPATLPWPKIAQTPPKIGTFLPSISVICRRQKARQRLRHRQADGLGHVVSSAVLAALLMPPCGRARQATPRSTPRSAPPCRRPPRRPSSCRPSHCSAASAKIVRPTAKPLTIGALAVAAKAASSSSCGASSPSSTTPRHHGSCSAITASIFAQALGRRLRLELPPVGLDAERHRAPPARAGSSCRRACRACRR